ncbi:protein-tyrosine phosphatase [Micromonospora pattaloongensis]|uniref:Protein-tyrosine phosphatase n=2 Tax=Micromonospora pattaloongensis TaxID=405436 RepID=A0A1H3PDS1_9ACTN|nr:protein-tyrosine phosphatase [Micromonospora pattaloongensis]
MVGGLLFVCHANLCRSPMAEYIARAMLTDMAPAADAPVAVSSAGTHAVPGQPMHPHAAAVAAQWSGESHTFRSRPVTAAALARAGVVLTATREQRGACVALAPGAIRRTFTLRQFSRLVTAATERGWPTAEIDAAPAERLAALVSTAGRARALVQPARAGEDDLADPLGQPLGQFRRCAGEIERALRPVVDVIAKPC